MAAPTWTRRTGSSTCSTTSTPSGGLSWNRLKGADAERGALMRAAAERAGCEAVLALAEVKETWDAWPSDSDPSDGYDYYGEYGDEEEDDSGDRNGDHDDYQLNDLIDDEIILGWWTSRDGAGGEPISLYVPDSEVCATTPNVNLVPFRPSTSSPTRLPSGCGRCVPAGRYPSMRGSDGSSASSSYTSMTSPAKGTRCPAGGRRYRDRCPARDV